MRPGTPKSLAQFRNEHYRALRRLNKHSIYEPLDGVLSVEVDLPPFGKRCVQLGLLRYGTLQESLNVLTKPVLEQVLKMNGLPHHGKKKDLIERICSCVPMDTINHTDAIQPIYMLTEKGEQCLQKYTAEKYPSRNELATSMLIAVTESEFQKKKAAIPWAAGTDAYDRDVLWAIIQDHKLSAMNSNWPIDAQQAHADAWRFLAYENRHQQATDNLLAALYCRASAFYDPPLPYELANMLVVRVCDEKGTTGTRTLADTDQSPLNIHRNELDYLKKHLDLVQPVNADIMAYSRLQGAKPLDEWIQQIEKELL